MRGNACKGLLHMLNKCYLYTINALYLCVMPMQLGWTEKVAQITEPFLPTVLPTLDVPATVSLALFENESFGLSGPVPTSNNGRISTASGRLFPALFRV